MNRGKIMSDTERKEILDWIYPRMNKFIQISYKKTFLPIHRKLTDEYTHNIHRQLTDEYTCEVDYYELKYDKSLPACIWAIKDRIIEKEGLQFYNTEPVLQDFLTVVNTGSHIHKHRDINYSSDIIHIRFNVFLELPKKGGDTFYNDVLINSEEGSYVLCKSGLHHHWSTVIEEGVRISISFGFNVPIERVNTMKSYEGDGI